MLAGFVESVSCGGFAFVMRSSWFMLLMSPLAVQNSKANIKGVLWDTLQRNL